MQWKIQRCGYLEAGWSVVANVKIASRGILLKASMTWKNKCGASVVLIFPLARFTLDIGGPMQPAPISRHFPYYWMLLLVSCIVKEVYSKLYLAINDQFRSHDKHSTILVLRSQALVFSSSNMAFKSVFCSSDSLI